MGRFLSGRRASRWQAPVGGVSQVLRFLVWRPLGLLAVCFGGIVLAWFLQGGAGRLLRAHSHARGGGSVHSQASSLPSLAGALLSLPREAWDWAPVAGMQPTRLASLIAVGVALAVLASRWRARQRRRYVRLEVLGHRTDRASADALVRMHSALHKRLLCRWWRRVLSGQPTVALEVHYEHALTDANAGGRRAWFAICCPQGQEQMMEAALRTAYSNCRLVPAKRVCAAPRRAMLRLKKDSEFVRRVKTLDRFEHDREPSINRLLTVMAACEEAVSLQIAMTPAPIAFERFARRRFEARERRLSHEDVGLRPDRSLVEGVELKGGLELQHRPLFFTDIRVLADRRVTSEQVASELRVETAENRLVERGTLLRHGLLGLYRRRIERGEGNPLPGFHRGVFATGELASLWHLPSSDYLAVPLAREAVPLAPAPPGIMRPREGMGTLRDAIGAVSIEPSLRKQNTAVPGAVEQGKSSYLVATVAEDLRRDRCAVIVLDPKGDAADAAVSLVASDRVCTLLDLANPTCGFNPLAVDAPADVIADYVVGALKNLFSADDIKASSDRYLRNAIIAVLAFDRSSTLWDAARLLSVGEDGYAYRRAVSARVRGLPELSEISSFFTSELSAQLADSRATTTAKLDAPVNKLARLLNSASIKRVLLNRSLTVDLDRVIAGREVLVVKGALGLMGAGNTSVLMQLLVGMLDAALARQQDLTPVDKRVAVALKVDEAPLVLTRGFAETMALKRSAGLETVACWQSDAQWVDREVRDQLDALFAHRVYFATASARDARDAIGLTSVEYTDTVRPGIGHLSKLARPDARLYLPKHHAIASWVTTGGRQSPFVARTIPMEIDRARLGWHAARQRDRGGRHLEDLRQPHWQRRSEAVGDTDPTPSGEPAEVSPGTESTPMSAAIASPSAIDANASETAAVLPDAPCDSFRELLELDLAQSVRWARRDRSRTALHPDAVDLDVLELIATLGHALSSQLHRRFNPTRAITTTQRRLKRLSEAGLVDRFQFYRRDGGGVPMCYVITLDGLELLGASGRIDAEASSGRGDGGPPAGLLASSRLRAGALDAPGARARHGRDRAQLRQARHEVHVAGWALALVAVAGDSRARVRGSVESVLTPPRRGPAGAGAPLSLAGLRLPAGRVPHDFLSTTASGEQVEVERFETLRPDAIVELGDARTDVIVELDDRLPIATATAKLRRYDHFLTGWCTHLRRYGERQAIRPTLVFVCRDRARARRCAELADEALIACRAYAGDYPRDWDYIGRARTWFVAERDLHEGLSRAYGVPRLPPAVRVAVNGGDPAAGELRAESRRLPVGEDLAR
jgi:hypothetical protein